MKWMVASDIHGSKYYCEKVFEAFEKEKADRLLLLGDLLYHGPRNDLPKEYDPKAVTKLLNAHKEVICAVRGNCDAEVDQMVLEFPIMADYMALNFGKWDIFASHGHLFDEEHPMPLKNGEILLCGHIHIQVCNDHGDFVYMNPGSASIPKEDSYHGYMTITEDEILWKELETMEVKNRYTK